MYVEDLLEPERTYFLNRTTLIGDVLANKGHEIEVCHPDDFIDSAVTHMHNRQVGSLLVMDGDGLVGILTERDLLVRVLAARRDPTTTKVREVMTHEVVVVRASGSIADAMSIITQQRCRHLPVLENGKVTGVVSAGDVTAWLVREQQQTIFELYQYVRQG